MLEDKKLTPELIAELVSSIAASRYKEKYITIEQNIIQLEKQVMLQILDVHWKDHLAEMDHLRQSVGLRAYAQKNPKNEYKREAFEMFETMLNAINTEAIKILFRLEIASEEEIQELEQRSLDAQKNKEMQLQQAKPELRMGDENASKTIPEPLLEMSQSSVEMIHVTADQVRNLSNVMAVPRSFVQELVIIKIF